MMPCTRIYVDIKSSPMIQARENRLLDLLKKVIREYEGGTIYALSL